MTHRCPKAFDFSTIYDASCTPTSDIHVEQVQVGKGRSVGHGEFFPLELVTTESEGIWRNELRFCLEEVTFNSRIFPPFGQTSFMVKDQEVINDLMAVEKRVQSLVPITGEFKPLLKVTQVNFQGKSYTFTSARTKITDKTRIFKFSNMVRKVVWLSS